MEPTEDVYREYKRLLGEGKVQRAYRGILQYLMNLQSRLKAEFPEFEVSAVYPGYMDMSYFSFTPKSLTSHGLKVAIVFLHETFTFQVWLGARNRQLQSKFVGLFEQAGWNPTEISTPRPGVDSIVEQVLVSEPNFEDPKSLSDQILASTIAFSEKVDSFLANQPNL